MVNIIRPNCALFVLRKQVPQMLLDDVYSVLFCKVTFLYLFFAFYVYKSCSIMIYIHKFRIDIVYYLSLIWKKFRIIFDFVSFKKLFGTINFVDCIYNSRWKCMLKWMTWRMSWMKSFLLSLSVHHTKIQVEWRMVHVYFCNMSSNLDTIFWFWYFCWIKTNGKVRTLINIWSIKLLKDIYFHCKWKIHIKLWLFIYNNIIFFQNKICTL